MKVLIGAGDKYAALKKEPKPPMSYGRFRALCELAAWGIYAGMVVAVAALCGFPGLITVGVVTVLIGAGLAMAT